MRQLETPDRLRGRMTGINMVFFIGGPQLGELEAGLVANWFGAPFSVVSGGIGTLVVVAATAVASPELRNFGALTDAKPLDEPAKEPKAYPQMSKMDTDGMVGAPAGED